MENTLEREIEEFEAAAAQGSDDCEVCKGTRGGVKGNENVVNGIVMCDYCTHDRI